VRFGARWVEGGDEDVDVDEDEERSQNKSIKGVEKDEWWKRTRTRRRLNG
jgi:hypothetical protein